MSLYQHLIFTLEQLKKIVPIIEEMKPYYLEELKTYCQAGYLEQLGMTAEQANELRCRFQDFTKKYL